MPVIILCLLNKEQAYTDRMSSWFSLFENHGPKTKPYMEDELAYLPVSLKPVNQLELVLYHQNEYIHYAFVGYFVASISLH